MSDAALSLFRLHVERRGDVRVDGTTREAYRELARAGLMVPISTFAGGPESAYRLTREGFERRDTLMARVKTAV